MIVELRLNRLQLSGQLVELLHDRITVSVAHHIPYHTLWNDFGSMSRSTKPKRTTAAAQKPPIK